MKSPICYLCNKDFGSEYFHFRTGGAVVQFADFKPLREGAAGHPQGLEWFCNEHLQAAQALAASTTTEALSKLHGRFGVFPPYESKPYRDPELWVTAVGPNAPKVFAILRHAAQVSPIEAKKLLANRVFKVAQGWPREFQGWQSALVEAGAQVEIRFP
jgi:hypothetical protein